MDGRKEPVSWNRLHRGGLSVSHVRIYVPRDTSQSEEWVSCFLMDLGYSYHWLHTKPPSELQY